MHPTAEPDVFTAGLRASALCQNENPLGAAAAARHEREGPGVRRNRVYTDEVLRDLSESEGLVGGSFDGARYYEVGRELDTWWPGPVQHGARAQSAAPLSRSPERNEQASVHAVDGRLAAIQQENLRLKRFMLVPPAPFDSVLSSPILATPLLVDLLFTHEAKKRCVWQATLARASAAARLPEAPPQPRVPAFIWPSLIFMPQPKARAKHCFCSLACLAVVQVAIRGRRAHLSSREKMWVS